MFVHDFTSVPLPVDVAIRAFAGVPPDHLAALVSGIWNAEAPILESASAAGSTRVATSRTQVELHSHRLRHDAAVISLRWRGDGWLPSLDADLELVSFGGQTTHLHIMGRYELPECVERFTDTGSLVQRMMVVVIRNFLGELGDTLCRADLPS
jgi:hypothetical protein